MPLAAAAQPQRWSTAVVDPWLPCHRTVVAAGVGKHPQEGTGPEVDIGQHPVVDTCPPGVGTVPAVGIALVGVDIVARRDLIK